MPAPNSLDINYAAFWQQLATAYVITLVTIGVLVGIGLLEAAWVRFRRDTPVRILDDLEIGE